MTIRKQELIVVLTVFSSFLGCTKCEDFEETKKFHNQSLHFKITFKERDGKYAIVRGVGVGGKQEEFKQVGMGEVLDNAVIGDSLIKIKYVDQVTLTRKGERMDIPAGCNDHYADKPKWYPIKLTSYK